MLLSTSCSVPTNVLIAAPFNILWGSSIYATVTATNLFGNSLVSTVGNGALILTIPDAPLNLSNVPSITSGYQIGLIWTKGQAEGGTPVFEYRIWQDQGNGNYIILADHQTVLSYTVTTL